MEKIKVLIADDHRVVREGLAAILKTKEDIQVVGEAQDGMEAVEKTRALLPDVVLMDVSMPRMSGVEATRQIKREFPHIGIVALTMYEEQQYIFDLVRAGATGYLLKDSESSQIVAAIRGQQDPRRVFIDGPEEGKEAGLGRARFDRAGDHRIAARGGRQDQQGNRQQSGPQRKDREEPRPQHLP
jgi:DNA-binding NarL/FixJ family response regulator